NFYAEWRAQNRAFHFLREGDSAPPENLLQAIWHHQRLQGEQLKTLEGKMLRVLHPGFWNREAGPDFRGAVLKIGDEIKTGDIEIDLVSGGWRGHGHDTNPNFKNVILHVVWEDEWLRPKNISILALKNFLDAPLSEIGLWLGSEAGQSWPGELSGRCCAPLRDLPAEKLTELLEQAALIRLQRKANAFQIRAQQAGWEQSLWEGIFRALGYKHNVWPMQRVAEVLPQLNSEKISVLNWQARLLGVSGLLPSESKTKSDVENYLRKIWECWWRERESFEEFIFPKTVWRFNGLRPANHPQRRLALASHWLADGKFLSNLEGWFTKEKSESELLKMLQPDFDEFWRWHWTFRSARLPKPQPLIGATRVTDLAINVILPWFWVRAVTGKNRNLQKLAEQNYFHWPAAEDNSILKLARQRLLGGKGNRFLKTAAMQQGLLQIVRDFCENSNAICANCRFPDLVKTISS
ncbi:MAG: DUF2851 family protein, partial [Limisphaerales bacterium]